MKPVQVTGHVDQNGKLELEPLPTFPPGEDVHVFVMETAGVAALEKMIELVSGMEAVDPELLGQLEAIDEALWDWQFANSKEVLKKLAQDAYADYQQGRTDELNLDELNWKAT